MADYKILIVDDEPEFLKTIVSILEKAGEIYEIFQAVSGVVAYRIAEKRFPDLIITDWEMPGMSGIELIKKLKGNPKTGKIPVIMCTGIMTSAENLRIALETGAVDYIRKPINEIELISRIRSMLLLVESFKEIQQCREQLLLKEKEILEYKVEIKDKELMVNTLNSVQSQKLMVSIAEELREILSISDDERIEEHIRSVINKLTISSSDAIWEEFSNYFISVHSEFFTNLHNICPQLTKNEIKICALLKLNLSTKDISAITMQSPRSVDVARYRLRKKLNLNPDENLLVFLSQF